jgi:hypothetical protein
MKLTTHFHIVLTSKIVNLFLSPHVSIVWSLINYVQEVYFYLLYTPCFNHNQSSSGNIHI